MKSGVVGAPRYDKVGFGANWPGFNTARSDAVRSEFNTAMSDAVHAGFNTATRDDRGSEREMKR